VRAGFSSRAQLVEHLEEFGPVAASTLLWRVELHHGGDGDRVEAALNDALGPDDVETIAKRLKRFDGRKPWTMETLLLIRRRPRVAAAKLAKSLGREKLPFKEDVRRLKRLGLTQSFEVGYEVSPRGKAYLAAAKKAARAKAGKKGRARAPLRAGKARTARSGRGARAGVVIAREK
jgi:hypothetical protein